MKKNNIIINTILLISLVLLFSGACVKKEIPPGPVVVIPKASPPREAIAVEKISQAAEEELFNVSPNRISLSDSMVSFFKVYPVGTGGRGHVSILDDDGNIVTIGFFYTGEGSSYKGFLLKTGTGGQTILQKEYSDGGDVCPYSIIQISDGNYVMTGTVKSRGADKNDCFVVKLDKSFNTLWRMEFGGAGDEICSKIIEAKDKGFVVAGTTDSKGSGKKDFYIVKLDQNGKLSWEQTFGTEQSDVARGIIQTQDGGYLTIGYIGTKGKNVGVLKLSAKGKQEWFTDFGDQKFADQANTIVQADKNGYLVAGLAQRESNSGVLLFKITEKGLVQWRKTYMLNDRFWALAQSVQAADDGGFLITGAGSHINDMGPDALLMKIDIDGNKEWLNLIGDDGGEYGNYLVQTSSGDTYITGYSSEKVIQEDNGMKKTLYARAMPMLIKLQ